MATAYVALALFAATVSFGPIAELRGRRYPVSTDIRRDFGIWCGITAMTHVVAGLQVHLRGKMWEYFVRPAKGVLLPRIDLFGAANYAGLVATLMLVALLATSNDASLRSLGATRWQRVHRLASWALVLTLLHGGAYQLIEKRGWAFVLVLDALAAGVLYLRIARASETAD
jgi:sulfoxide reductase heme-binding subunit YedZ